MADKNNDNDQLVKYDATLGEAGKVLVEKVSKGLGDACAPWLTKQRVKAEKREIEWEIEKRELLEQSGLPKRVMNRFIAQETRKQINIEGITLRAAKQLKDNDTASVHKIDEDWLADFFNRCDTVSDLDMQAMWSRILAGEAKKTGSFSRKTISIVSTMDKELAQLFTKLCQFVWQDNDADPTLIVYDWDLPVYASKNIVFSASLALAEAELISHQMDPGYGRSYSAKDTPVWSYHNKAVHILNTPFNNDRQKYIMDTGRLLLTTAGRQLYPICGAQFNEEFYNYIVGKWRNDGLDPIEVEATV